MVDRFTVPVVAQRAQRRGPMLGLCLGLVSAAFGQTTIDMRTQTRNVDFSGAGSTRPIKTGTSLPSSCGVGELFFKSDAALGKNIYVCAPVDQWAAIAAGTTSAEGGNYAATFTGMTSVALQHNLNTTAVTV